MRVRKWVPLLVLLSLSTAAHAGTAAPELDPSSLAAGVGLASAIVLLLTDRRRRRRPTSPDERPGAADPR